MNNLRMYCRLYNHEAMIFYEQGQVIQKNVN